MTQEDIARLITERRLAAETFDGEQIAAMWTKAITALADSQSPGISADTALQTAYRGCLQATIAVLASAGLRVKSTAGHYIAFYALRKLDEEQFDALAVAFDSLRSTRSESIYEPVGDSEELADHLAIAVRSLQTGLPAIRAWMVNRRPELGDVLLIPA